MRKQSRELTPEEIEAFDQRIAGISATDRVTLERCTKSVLARDGLTTVRPGSSTYEKAQRRILMDLDRAGKTLGEIDFGE